MDLGAQSSETRFSAYVEGLVSVIGHADRAKPLRDYCTGLLLPCERKSVEPIAAVTAPGRTAAQHQSLLHFVGEGRWLDATVLAKVREMVLPAIERQGPIEAWIIDDTAFPKKGIHSVGVARQYCCQLGKQDNCQVAVSLSLANAYASLPVAYRLYLPETWASDAARRKKAGVPAEIGFQTKIKIALDQIRAACAAGLPRGVVLMDAGYGNHSELRSAVAAQALRTRPRAAHQAVAPQSRAPAGQSQGPCAQPSSQGLADDHLARGHECAAQIPFCTPAHPHRTARLQPQRALAEGMAPDRMAQGGEGADKVLAFKPARRRRLCPSR
jgi:SRSO17 transposase